MRISDWSSDVCSSDLMVDSAENMVARGGYELIAAEGGKAKVTLLGTGSEVGIAAAARDLLQKDGIPTRVVSMPCFELFDAQPADYQRQVLGPDTVKVAVEAGIRQGWDRYLDCKGTFVGKIGRASCRERVCQNV